MTHKRHNTIQDIPHSEIDYNSCIKHLNAPLNHYS